jgi:hypothetical protein
LTTVGLNTPATSSPERCGSRIGLPPFARDQVPKGGWYGRGAAAIAVKAARSAATDGREPLLNGGSIR